MSIARTAFILATLLLLAAAWAPSALAQRSGFGLGVILGEPTGFSCKGWVNETAAIDAALAWSFVDETAFHVHLDYVWHTDAVTKKPDLPAYYGIGGRIKTGGNGDDRIGVRLVGGIAWYIPDTPMDAFFEVAPIIDLAPETGVTVNAALGARYFFR